MQTRRRRRVTQPKFLIAYSCLCIFQEEDASEERGDDESKTVKKEKSNDESEIELMTDKDTLTEIEDIEKDKEDVSNDVKKIQSNSLLSH